MNKIKVTPDKEQFVRTSGADKAYKFFEEVLGLKPTNETVRVVEKHVDGTKTYACLI